MRVAKKNILVSLACAFFGIAPVCWAAAPQPAPTPFAGLALEVQTKMHNVQQCLHQLQQGVDDQALAQLQPMLAQAKSSLQELQAMAKVVNDQVLANGLPLDLSAVNAGLANAGQMLDSLQQAAGQPGAAAVLNQLITSQADALQSVEQGLQKAHGALGVAQPFIQQVEVGLGAGHTKAQIAVDVVCSPEAQKIVKNTFADGVPPVMQKAANLLAHQVPGAENLSLLAALPGAEVEVDFAAQVADGLRAVATPVAQTVEAGLNTGATPQQIALDVACLPQVQNLVAGALPNNVRKIAGRAATVVAQQAPGQAAVQNPNLAQVLKGAQTISNQVSAQVQMAASPQDVVAGVAGLPCVQNLTAEVLPGYVPGQSLNPLTNPQPYANLVDQIAAPSADVAVPVDPGPSLLTQIGSAVQHAQGIAQLAAAAAAAHKQGVANGMHADALANLQQVKDLRNALLALPVDYVGPDITGQILTPERMSQIVANPLFLDNAHKAEIAASVAADPVLQKALQGAMKKASSAANSVKNSAQSALGKAATVIAQQAPGAAADLQNPTPGQVLMGVHTVGKPIIQTVQAGLDADQPTDKILQEVIQLPGVVKVTQEALPGYNAGDSLNPMENPQPFANFVDKIFADGDAPDPVVAPDADREPSTPFSSKVASFATTAEGLTQRAAAAAAASQQGVQNGLSPQELAELPEVRDLRKALLDVSADYISPKALGKLLTPELMNDVLGKQKFQDALPGAKIVAPLAKAAAIIMADPKLQERMQGAKNSSKSTIKDLATLVAQQHPSTSEIEDPTPGQVLMGAHAFAKPIMEKIEADEPVEDIAAHIYQSPLVQQKMQDVAADLIPDYVPGDPIGPMTLLRMMTKLTKSAKSGAPDMQGMLDGVQDFMQQIAVAHAMQQVQGQLSDEDAEELQQKIGDFLSNYLTQDTVNALCTKERLSEMIASPELQENIAAAQETLQTAQMGLMMKDMLVGSSDDAKSTGGFDLDEMLTPLPHTWRDEAVCDGPAQMVPDRWLEEIDFEEHATLVVAADEWQDLRPEDEKAQSIQEKRDSVTRTHHEITRGDLARSGVFLAQRGIDAAWCQLVHKHIAQMTVNFFKASGDEFISWKAGYAEVCMEHGEDRFPEMEADFNKLFDAFANKYASMWAVCTNPALLMNTALSVELAMAKKELDVDFSSTYFKKILFSADRERLQKSLNRPLLSLAHGALWGTLALCAKPPKNYSRLGLASRVFASHTMQALSQAFSAANQDPVEDEDDDGEITKELLSQGKVLYKDLAGQFLPRYVLWPFEFFTRVDQAVDTACDYAKTLNKEYVKPNMPRFMYKRIVPYIDRHAKQAVFLHWYLNHVFLPALRKRVWLQRDVFWRHITNLSSQDKGVVGAAEKELFALTQNLVPYSTANWLVMQQIDPAFWDCQGMHYLRMWSMARFSLCVVLPAACFLYKWNSNKW